MRVVARNQLTSDVSYDPLARSGPPSQSGGLTTWVMREIVRPAFYLEGVPGLGTVAIEPYGKPTQNLGLPVAIGVGLAAVGLAVAFWAVAQAVERRR